MKSLSAFIDSDGQARVGGRLKNANMSYATKHPLLLPHDDHISLLIMRDSHYRGHYGVATTVAISRQQYWIVGAHRLAKKIKHQCVTCKKLNPKPEVPMMADLPSERLAPCTPPFHVTACDYFGPLQVKISRNKRAKNYGVLFTCLNTRAVHLELAADSSTQEFLQVLRRFFAIRGRPSIMYSDNGTQFVGAERELKEMIAGWDKKKLQEYGAERGMEWKFTTPAAPHQNGCAEALVKTCKAALKRAIGDQSLTSFELYTCLLEVMNLVNQRPIGRLPNDPDDGSYICPNDILLGRATSDVPQGPFKETKNLRCRVELVQNIVDSFWKRWRRDVLPVLIPRKKWKHESYMSKVNDIVVVQDTNLVRSNWTVGRIIEVYRSQDGRVRNVKVKTPKGEYVRPVTKIATIYSAEENDCE